MSGAFVPILDRSIVITCGSGGVGKTTVAASIALKAAQQGKRVLALTIDPARRLADSMGVALGNAPTSVPREIQDSLGIPAHGDLSAMMLDTKSTFDTMVHALAPSPEVEAQILANRYYQQISNSMVGSQEYMAMVKLVEVFDTRRFDLIVLDTPPSRHALDFLKAPGRLQAVLEEGALSWLMRSRGTFWRIGSGVAKQMKTVLSKMEQILGLSVLADLSEFLTAFSDLMAGFREKAVRVQALLRAERTGFVLVASPDRTSLEEASFFYAQLKEQGLPFLGFIVNRALPLDSLGATPQATSQLLHLGDEAWAALFPADPPPPLTPETWPALIDKLQRRFKDIVTLADLDRENLTELARSCPGPLGLIQLPELPEDVHDLKALQLLGDLLFTRQALIP